MTHLCWLSARTLRSFTARIGLAIAVGLFASPAVAAPIINGPDTTDRCPAVEKPTVAEPKKTDDTKAGAPATSTPPAASTTSSGAPAASTNPTVGSALAGANPFASNDTFSFSPPTIVANSPKVSTAVQLIDTILNILFLLAAVLFIILIPIGGLQWMAAAGNEEGSTKARRLLLAAVIGLFLTFAAQGIANFVFRQLGVNVGFGLAPSLQQIINLVPGSNGGATGGTNGNPSTVLPGQRSVTFELVTTYGTFETSNGVTAPMTPSNLGLTLVDQQQHTFGVTTDSVGRVRTTIALPVEATTLNVYLSGNAQRTDTIVGSFTIPADYTSYGCIPLTINSTSALISVTLAITPPPALETKIPNTTPLTITVLSFDPKESIPPQQVSSTGGSATFQLHSNTVYHLTAVAPGFSTSYGTFSTPGYNDSARTIQVNTTTSSLSFP